MYIDAQRNACRSGDTSRGECTNTIGDFCGTAGNAEVGRLFDTLCLAGDTYNNDRTAYCTVGDKIFETVCDNNAYATNTTTKREEACRSGVLPSGANCTKTISDFCEVGDSATANIFDSLCTAGYADERKTACKIYQGPLLSNCMDTITLICREDPFTQTTGTTQGDLCVDTTGTTHADARESACRESLTAPNTRGASISNCVPVLRDVCGELDNADTTAIFGDELCTASATYTPARIKFCSADNPEQGALTACSQSGDNVVNTICNGGEANRRLESLCRYLRECHCHGGYHQWWFCFGDRTEQFQSFLWRE